MNNKKLSQAIITHRSIASELLRSEILDFSQDKRVPKYVALGEEIALALSSLRCEQCQSGEKLTLHHIIERRCSAGIPKKRYVVQRHSFSNIVILCLYCHKKVHGQPPPSFRQEELYLSGKLIISAKNLIGEK